MTNDSLRARLWLIGQKVLLSRQITVAVGVSIRIRATIRQVGKQVLLVVVRAELKFLLLHCVYLKKNSQMCGHVY